MKDLLKKTFNYVLNCSNVRDPFLWVFTEWYGKRCGDNATYLANFVAENRNNIKVIWIAEKNCDTSMLHERIQIFEKDSKQAIRALQRAAVVIMIQGMDEFTTPGYNFCGNALKVNLWHGVMWKRLGYDIAGHENEAHNLRTRFKHKFKRSYLFEAPSEEYKNKLKSAFAVTDDEIVLAGYPRNSLFYDPEKIKTVKCKVLNRVGSIHRDYIVNKIILYMPTFRDLGTPNVDLRKLKEIDGLESFLRDNNIVVIQKAHFVIGDIDKSNTVSDVFIDINDISAQELLAASDMLITDYSSCFFDYLLLDRPIIHYIYDYEEYKNNDRGIYYDWQDVVCGDVAFDENTLVQCIKNNILNDRNHCELRHNRVKQFMTYENSDSCKTITEKIESRLSTSRKPRKNESN